jgi:NADH-quinone oxidoreductase subunit F
MDNVTKLSGCGLGQSACKALYSAIKHRRAEFQAHIDGVCSVGTCKMNGGDENVIC